MQTIDGMERRILQKKLIPITVTWRNIGAADMYDYESSNIEIREYPERSRTEGMKGRILTYIFLIPMPFYQFVFISGYISFVSFKCSCFQRKKAIFGHHVDFIWVSLFTHSTFLHCSISGQVFQSI